MAILIIYFPQNATTPNGISWSIEQEAYRGLPPTQNPSQTKPDVIAVRLNPIPVPQGQVPQIEGRDFLWVECKAASHDKASGWKDVLNESVMQLAHEHSTRPLYLIIAVGWKCMLFLWDPIGIVQQQPQYQICSEDKTKQWAIDTRIKAIRSTPWVNMLSGEIIPRNAMELDSWTLAPAAAGTNVLANGNNLGIIEPVPPCSSNYTSPSLRYESCIILMPFSDSQLSR
jgi:hypothetical protein